MGVVRTGLWWTSPVAQTSPAMQDSSSGKALASKPRDGGSIPSSCAKIIRVHKYRCVMRWVVRYGICRTTLDPIRNSWEGLFSQSVCRSWYKSLCREGSICRLRWRRFPRESRNPFVRCLPDCTFYQFSDTVAFDAYVGSGTVSPFFQ